MPGNTVLQGAQPVEYKEEEEFGQPLEDAEWEWIGLINSHSPTQEVESETINFLPEANEENKLEQRQNVKTSESYSGDTTYHPQEALDFEFLRFFTGEDGSTSSEISPFQIGEMNEEGGEYRRLLGVVGDDWELSISEDSVAEISASWMAADAEDWSSTDYVGDTGSHASADGSEVLAYDDLGEVLLDGEELGHAIEDLTLSVSNDLEIVKDPNSEFGTDIFAIEVTDREIEVELGLTYSSFDMAQIVRNYEPQELTFEFGGRQWTIPGVQFPEFPYEMSPEDLVGDSVSSDPATGLLWEPIEA